MEIRTDTWAEMFRELAKIEHRIKSARIKRIPHRGYVAEIILEAEDE